MAQIEIMKLKSTAMKWKKIKCFHCESHILPKFSRWHRISVCKQDTFPNDENLQVANWQNATNILIVTIKAQ